MAVRLAPSTIATAKLPTVEPIRPDYRWVDKFDEYRFDLPAWYYPWQGSQAYRTPVLPPADQGERVAGLRMFDTHRPGREASKGPLRPAVTFTDMLYGRLQLNPSFLPMGNLLSSQSRQIELWNASFQTVTLNQILGTNADGIDIELPSPLPIVLRPLQAITITVSVSSTGPTVIDARFLFDADIVGDIVLQVTGTRSVVFSLMPDTSKPYIEKLTWVSDVLTSQSGEEQRIAINEYPDTQISMTVHQHKDKLHNLASLLWGWQHRIYSLPLWHLHTNLSQASSLGTQTLMCNTQYTGLQVGGVAIIWAEYDHFETVEVAEIQPDRILTVRPTTRVWPRGALLAACRSARLPQEVSQSWTHADLAEIPLTFVLTEVEQGVAGEMGGSYRGDPLLMIPPNWVSELDERHVRNIDIFESDLKARFTVLNNELPYVVRSHAWFLNSKEKIAAYRRWLISRRGRVVPFWMPSWKNDMVMAQALEAGSRQLVIQNINYRSFYTNRIGRQDIIMFLRNGQRIMQRISSATEGPIPGTEILVLEQEFENALAPSMVTMISFLGLHRLDSDEVEIDWRSDKLALSNNNMRLLTDGV